MICGCYCGSKIMWFGNIINIDQIHSDIDSDLFIFCNLKRRFKNCGLLKLLQGFCVHNNVIFVGQD